GRQKLIQFYAPCEPLVMQNIMKFLEVEKKMPLKTLHRISDVLASTTMATKVMTDTEIYNYIENLPDELAIAIGPCACRLDTAEELGPDARDIAADRLEMFRQTPTEVDVQIGTCGEKFGKLETYRMISKKELLEKEHEFQNMGLVSNVYIIRDGDAGICHCSSATCAPFIANEAIDYKSKVIIHGDSIAVTDKTKCEASGRCIGVCHFNAREIVTKNGVNHSALVSPDRCYGCGQCVKVCPGNAIKMVPRRNWPEYVMNEEVPEELRTRT
ncbi:MAG: 4Fe-4S dicluster domain-containing protein, partial [Thermodesulfobacteriota bacterium]|nr:4Fe-4S dicluster domain-containing protein [Thermodesulfobacteriota bacterium]